MREFIEEISRILELPTDLLEKDFILHRILLSLSKTKFAEEFAFKGGSCLIKHYLGYYRFSIDLDFTFINQSIFKGLSQKSIRRLLSEKIDSIGTLFEHISEKIDLEFKCNKSDKRYVELGGGNKFLTFKLWFHSILGPKTFVKIQINFLEDIVFPIKEVRLKSICPKSEKLDFLFPKLYRDYRELISFKVYDIREILCEKIRAILTRRGLKERDFIDVYMIFKIFNLSYKSLEKETLRKLKFILKLYQKYRRNLKDKIPILTIENLQLGSERYLLITKIDENDFYLFLNDFISWLRKPAKIALKDSAINSQ